MLLVFCFRLAGFVFLGVLYLGELSNFMCGSRWWFCDGMVGGEAGLRGYCLSRVLRCFCFLFT
jgi:hypothetical protein